MRVIAELSSNSQIATYYQLNWQVIPNLAMDLIVPPLARLVNVYVAGQIFLVATFALIISGVLMLNRALIGRFSVVPLLANPGSRLAALQSRLRCVTKVKDRFG
jgi:hypothetical protein